MCLTAVACGAGHIPRAKRAAKQALCGVHNRVLNRLAFCQPVRRKASQKPIAPLDAVVWGVSDPKRGGGTEFGIFAHPGINHHPEVVTGVLEDESKAVLQDFFRARRNS